MDQNALLKAIAQGFQKTPWELFLSFIIITGIVILAIAISYIYKSVLLSRSSKKWISEYDELIRKLDLTINELDLIDELSTFLMNPIRKTLLLNNKNTFNLALSKLKKKKGKKSEYENNLMLKIFGDTREIVKQRPVRFISKDGNVYSGRLSSREGKKICINEVKLVGEENPAEAGRLMVQDFRGLDMHSVTNVHEIGTDSLQLIISETPLQGKERARASQAYIISPESKSPLQTRIQMLDGGKAFIENPQGQLKVNQAVKVSIRTNINKQFWVNAIVISVSLHKKYAKLQFGYIK